MRPLLILVTAVLVAAGVAVGSAAALVHNQADKTGRVGAVNSTSTCKVAPSGIIGGSPFNRQSPMVVNSLGAVGSGQLVAACVAWVDKVTGRRTVSAPIFTYSDVSDEQPSYVVASDSLWVYDVATTRGPELLRMSNTTHEVLQRVTMPAFIRPAMAADAEGLWIGIGLDGGSARSDLYFVGRGSTSPRSELSGPRYEGIGRICLGAASAWISVPARIGSATKSTGYRIDRPGDIATPDNVDPFSDCPVEYQTFGSPQN